MLIAVGELFELFMFVGWYRTRYNRVVSDNTLVAKLQDLSKLSVFFRKSWGKYEENGVKSAIEKVMLKQMTIRTASTKFGLPRSTLGDRVKILLKGGEITPKPCCSNNKGVFQKTFTDEQEEILYEHVKALDGQLMPLNRTEFLKLAYNLAKRLNVCHRFNKEKCMAGKDFYYEFMNLHKDLSLRTAESTSLQRAVGFSKDKVNRFFHQLTELMDKHKFNPTHTFNADQTGLVYTTIT